MADVGIIDGEKLLIQIGDGDVPENFVHPCLITAERGLAFTSNVTETEVRDCAQPSLPAKIVRKVRSVDFTVSGAGKVDKTSVFAYIEWWKSGVAKNARIEQNATGAEGGWLGVGSLILKDMNLTGDPGDYQEFTATFVPASVFVWTKNA